MTRLDLGCGPNCREGFEGVDAVKAPGVKHVMDVTDIKAWEKLTKRRKIDEIVCYGFLEHLSKLKAAVLIRTSLIALEKGGRFEVEVPDLEWSCRFFLENPHSRFHTSGDDRGIVFIYGMQNNDFEFHKSGYTQDFLELLLKQMGFKRVVVRKQFSHGQGMLLAEGYK